VNDPDAGVVGQGIIIGKYGLMVRATASPNEIVSRRSDLEDRRGRDSLA
jgi:hypothetical protein